MIIKYHNERIFWNNTIKVWFDKNIKITNLSTMYCYSFTICVDKESLVKKIVRKYFCSAVRYVVSDSKKGVDFLNTKKQWKYEINGELCSRNLLSWNELWNEFFTFANANLKPRGKKQ